MNRKTQVCLIVIAMIIALVKPYLPVWAGLALLGFVAARAERDLASSSPRTRRTAFKRMAFLSVVGVLLVSAGMCIGASPWDLTVTTVAQARHAMAVLAVYALAALGTPILVFAYLSKTPTMGRCGVRKIGTLSTLSGLAAGAHNRRVKTAV